MKDHKLKVSLQFYSKKIELIIPFDTSDIITLGIFTGILFLFYKDGNNLFDNDLLDYLLEKILKK